MQIVIESIGFSTTEYFLSLEDLALHNGIPSEKYIQGIGQKSFSILPPDEDIVTLAYKASMQILANVDLSNIKFLFFATETSFDNSKSAAVYLHALLQLPESCRIIELKHGCYSATSAIILAKSFLESLNNIEEKCLVIASDAALYPLASNAEPTQGAASIAVLLSRNESVGNSLATLGSFGGVITKNSYDFFKPNYLAYPFVNGKLSIAMYLSFLKKSFSKFLQEFDYNFNMFADFCFHTPFPKMVIKAINLLMTEYKLSNEIERLPQINDKIFYNENIGNTYTASLYLSFISLLETSNFNYANKTIGLFSYGSGSSSEIFTLCISNNYKSRLHQKENLESITSREKIPYEQYKFFHEYKMGNNTACEKFTHKTLRLASIKNHIRNYEFL